MTELLLLEQLLTSVICCAHEILDANINEPRHVQVKTATNTHGWVHSLATTVFTRPDSTRSAWLNLLKRIATRESSKGHSSHQLPGNSRRQRYLPLQRDEFQYTARNASVYRDVPVSSSRFGDVSHAPKKNKSDCALI